MKLKKLALYLSIVLCISYCLTLILKKENTIQHDIVYVILLEEKEDSKIAIKSNRNFNRNNVVVSNIIRGQMTFYTSYCKGCSGITANGFDVRNTIYYRNYRILACPREYPFGTKFRFRLEGQYLIGICKDRGGAIRNNIFDLLVESREEAFRLGRRNLEMELIG